LNFLSHSLDGARVYPLKGASAIMDFTPKICSSKRIVIELFRIVYKWTETLALSGRPSFEITFKVVGKFQSNNRVYKYNLNSIHIEILQTLQ